MTLPGIADGAAGGARLGSIYARTMCLSLRPGRRQRIAHDGLSLGLDPAQMIHPLKTFSVDFIDILGAGGSRREPSALGNHLEAADRRAVARRLGQDGLDRFAGQFGGPDLLRRELRQLPFLLRRRRGLDTIVDRIAEFTREITVKLARIAPPAGRDLRR